MDFLFLVNIIALLFSFFVIGAIFGAFFSKPIREKLVAFLRLEVLQRLLLNKSSHNPILKPGTHPWTAEAVMNPAAAVLGGRTHLIYRAIGMDGVSRLGYASSADGVFFDKILPYPVYVARNPHNLAMHRRVYSPMLYPSGGSWGGCEDPRMVVIDGQVYVTFNMFENWNLRVAVISMSEEDFLALRFTEWEGPHILSHGERDKNWVLFPEKIGGQFAVLHSIIGTDKNHVRIEYIDDLATLRQREFISPDPQKIPDKLISWHVHTRSAGPPPIRTEKGWLVLYHANDAHEPWRYKLGAMLLDLVDPTKVLYRAAAPVLTPDEHYENDGKPGIVYAAGAVVRDGTLFVYYGGADKVVCVATAPLDAFLDALIEGSQASLTTAPAQAV
jgi:beta-1,2-mannobiose phosphorylase / 1,2-beta-oligomannan phosphorylase